MNARKESIQQILKSTDGFLIDSSHDTVSTLTTISTFATLICKYYKAIKYNFKK